MKFGSNYNIFIQDDELTMMPAKYRSFCLCFNVLIEPKNNGSNQIDPEHRSEVSWFTD